MISLTKVSKSHDGGRTFAVRDVSLHVPEGNLLALVGTAGCGKTTVLEMINRLSEPDKGTVEVDGRDVSKEDPIKLRRKIGYVVQKSGLFPHMTVRENIAVVPRLLGWPETDIRERVEELLRDVVDLKDERDGEGAAPRKEGRNGEGLGDRFPSQLSGGQQQRVSFARALAARPKILLLDEPFGALDPLTRDRVREVFLEWKRKLGLTAVMVTHDMAEALMSADLIGVMKKVKTGDDKSEGRLLPLGTPQKLMADPGDDYVRTLLETPKRQADQIEALKVAKGGQPA
jgi:osmoprotectant transport system ATP-binding protein